jgi:hypothetical protein
MKEEGLDMNANQMAQETEERATQRASLRAKLIQDAARRPEDPRMDGVSSSRSDRKWWEFFCFPHA